MNGMRGEKQRTRKKGRTQKIIVNQNENQNSRGSGKVIGKKTECMRGEKQADDKDKTGKMKRC